MNIPFVFTSEIKVISLRAKDTFKRLELTNACIIQGQAYPESTPHIEFTLLGDGIKFTAYANLIPNSYEFNCFNLLEAAKQAMGQHEQIFERVEIQAFDKYYEAEYRIEGEIEADDKSDEK